METKKGFAVRLLRQIFSALHEKRFADAAALADESTMDAGDLAEFVQGTAELNGFSSIDEYRESNLCAVDEETEDPFWVESCLSADGGNDLPLCLRLKLQSRPDGTWKTWLDIQPN